MNAPGGTIVGVVGLGNMGGGICRNLIRSSGHDVVFFDLNEAAMDACASAGGRPAGSVAEVAGAADVLFTSLPTPAAMEAVALGADGIAGHARPGTVYFDLTTNSLALVRRAAAALAEKGVTMLDAPVSGGPSGAEAGTLTVMAGGDRAAFDAQEPLLGSFAANTVHLGEIGTGTIAKLVNNMLIICYMTTAAEGLALGLAAGIDPHKLDAVVRSSSGNSIAWQSIADRGLSGDYSPSFALDLCYKDIHLALELADELRIPAPHASSAADLLRTALRMGYAKQDPTIVFHVYEQTLGLSANGGTA